MQLFKISLLLKIAEMSHDQQYPVVNQPQAYGAYGAPTSPSPQQHLMGPPQHVGGKVGYNNYAIYEHVKG